jgi:hypothetical protein
VFRLGAFQYVDGALTERVSSIECCLSIAQAGSLRPLVQQLANPEEALGFV